MSILPPLGDCSVVWERLKAECKGWLIRKTTLPEKVLLIAAGLALVYPGWLPDLIGFVLFGLAVLLQSMRSRSRAAGTTPLGRTASPG